MCQLSLLLPTGGDTARTEQMMVEVDEKQQEVIDQGLALGKFLGTLLVDAAAILTGDVELLCGGVLSRANGGQAVVRQNTVELAQESQTLASYNFSVEGWPMPPASARGTIFRRAA